ncbi:uncharacterized protein LOC124656833 [Lolium rigidum]|uniref:uncharacterized protein LOC124656833 n=1 Tax=Lolium rigidum TaxID=89674 RepID=UPI001F5CF234|nr:uncharacterized protein LOC124656833 [Lolium rigidum]
MGRGQRLRRGRLRPSPAPTPVGDHRPTSLYRLSGGQEDRDGVLVADDDIDGSTRSPADHVCRDLISNRRRARPSHLPPLHAEPNVLDSEELLDTTTLKADDSSLLQPTSPLKDELILTPQLRQALDEAQAKANLFLTQPSDSAYQYWVLEEPDMFTSNELFIAMATLGESPITDASSKRALVATHSPTPPISARKPTGWNHQFFIRVDLDQVFHTYPKLGGPFQSLEEAEMAIFLRLDELQDPKMCTNDGLSWSEIAIRDALYWPDGTSQYSSRSNPDEDHMGLLVQALLDKYNEENTLSGDCAYQVENVVSFQEVYEGDAGWYYHLNCTRKTEGGVGNLFFAEVSKTIRGEIEEFELTCLHMLESIDNGTCYGCTSEVIGMIHPIGAGKYKGGHDPSWPRGYGSHPLDFPDVDKDDPLVFPKDVDAWRKANEERIRCLFQDDDEEKSDAGRTPACSDMSQGRRQKYVIPARRQFV